MKPRRASSGFSLVEVILALGIAVFCLVPLVALLPVGLKTHQTANEQTKLVSIAAMIVQDLENTPSTSTTTPRFKFTMPSASSGTSVQSLYLDASGTQLGTPGANPPRDAFYCVTLGITPPSSGQRTASSARIMVSWPAQADRSSGRWPSHYTGIFQTTVALDRN